MAGLQNAIDRMLQKNGTTVHEENVDIAIVGVDFKLPGASNFDELDDVLRSGKDQINEPSEARKKLMSPFLEEDKFYQYVPGAYLEDIDKFDFPFFKMTRKEAQLMDPYQRLFLETAWSAFEDAGLTEQMLLGSKTGVFVGCPQPHPYFECVREQFPEDQLMAGPGNIQSVIASRISYLMDFHGPAMMIDTACSSSLVALNEACLSIQSKQCDIALVGALNLLLPSVMEEDEVLPDIISSTFRARTFSDDTDGTGIGECVAAIVLKPMKDALRDKDCIYAVIKGIHVNNDGKSLGLTAPNRSAQTEVIRDTWKKAGIHPESIGYVEAHGTGTELGDPIELSALQDAFLGYTQKKQFCAIGSTKTVFGHTDSAAGMVGVLKCLASFKNKKWYSNTNFTIPTTKFDFMDSPFYVINSTEEWHDSPSDPKVCAVSSFGLSGTNCHLLLQEYPVNRVTAWKEEGKAYLLPLSAKTNFSLLVLVKQYIAFLKKDTDFSLNDFCYTAQMRRNHYHVRVAILFQSRSELLNRLQQCCEDLEHGNVGEKLIYPDPVRGDLEHNQKLDPELLELAENYVSQQLVKWYSDKEGSGVMSLPVYAFERKSVWLNDRANGKELLKQSKDNHVKERKKMDSAHIQNTVQRIVSEIFDLPVDSVPVEKDFFEFGFDSITIVQLKREILDLYKVDIPLDDFFKELHTIEKVSEYIGHTGKDLFIEAEVPEEIQSAAIHPPAAAVNDQSVVNLFNRQLDIIQEQIRSLSRIEGTAVEKVKALPTIEPLQHTSSFKPKQGDDSYSTRFLVKRNTELTEEQQSYLNELVVVFNEKFKASKQFLRVNKELWANGRFSQGYSRTWQDMVIPVFAEKAQGTSMTDMDGNVFIDFCMGFGVNLFGYNHPLIHEVISREIDSSLILGSMTRDAAEVSALIRKATGVERLAYCNSGTEAIMNLLRIARAVTEKNEVVIFKNSYHGTFDGVYVAGSGIDAAPLSLGTLESMVQHVKVFEYGADGVFDYIAGNADRIAAVLIEPIQSRNPDLQPQEFLRRLRAVTSEHQILFVFDEVITGFRLALGGAQEYYGVEADLVAYGKVIGGGLPIGIFGGKAKYMAAVDGGVWNTDEGAAPFRSVIQTGGTFCHHPLSMKAAKAVLNYLLRDNGRLQKRLNHKTKTMADFLNNIFDTNGIDLHISVGGSQFIFQSSDPTLMRFLYYMMLYRNIFIWEGGTCYISTVHTDEDIAELALTILDNLRILAERRCISCGTEIFSLDHAQLRERLLAALIYQDERSFNFPVKDRDKLEELWDSNEIQFVTPVTPMQYLMNAQNINGRRNGDDVSYEIFYFEADIDPDLLNRACTAVVKRNPVLRSECRWRRLSHPVQVTYYIESCNFRYLDFSALLEEERAVALQKVKEEIKNRGFNDQISKIDFILIKHGSQRYDLCLFYLNSLFDGWSSNNLFNQIITNYERGMQSLPMQDATDDSYIEYAQMVWREDQQAQQKFWLQELADYRGTEESSEEGSINSYEEQVYTEELEPVQFTQLQRYTSSLRVSMFAVLQAAWALLHQYHENRDDVIIGVVTSGRNNTIRHISDSVGLYTNILPLAVQKDQTEKGRQYVQKISLKLLQLMDHENVTVYDIAELAEVPVHVLQQAVDRKTLVFLNYPEKQFEHEVKVLGKDESSNLNVSHRIYVEVRDGTLHFTSRYNRHVYTDEQIKSMMDKFLELIVKLINES
ncbi:aminotransferase class III-fold pyridoxal phosphate-dependent enzyme [Paenibacillus bouchesdurhonensis]|uniref:aminotransferase class III-fold pyridoxal phosphate-dependent enzyme n=1 Tax=Paenibacillus bouchesdurhonensis TaxID=1870990 RepID=UPI000DA630C8|nr:aminotransferase class III-fold pyridoxal phosphate-dependent enzyme [Paenibacillus bouchesdurhonensis]